MLDAREPRQTGMDIWREPGNRLTVQMPVPQKCSDTHKHTHSEHTQLHWLSGELSHPYFLLSHYLRTPSAWALWEFWNLLDFPASLSAKGRRPIWMLHRFCKCPPTEREDGKADKGKKWQAHSEHRALFKEPSAVDCFPPSHFFVCVFCLARVRVSSFRVCCLVPALTAGPGILSKSHRLSFVWNREVLLGGQANNETGCCLHFY